MYPVSEEYKKAMKEDVQQFRMTGTIGDYSFSDENILSGSFSIINQCSGDDLISIGQVYIGELSATFLGVPIERYAWKDKEIVPYFGIRIQDGSFEDIPLGVFTISTTEWTESGVVVKAYDKMAKLDKSCLKTLKNGTAYELAVIACEECEVELGTTEEEFLALPNGSEILSEYEENDVETWRDLFSWLSQSLGCFVTADREGRIVFRQYTSTVVDVIDDAHRFKGASFSDYETRYTGLSIVNIADKTTKYYGLELDDGLTYNLGSNPFLQYGVDETRDDMRIAVLEALIPICYVPFKATAIGNPAYDLGDVLVFSGGIADGDKKYCITKYRFKYNGDYEMEGVGSDPALATAKSKSDKNLIGLMSEVDNQGMKYYVLRNVEDIKVTDGEKKQVFPARFAVAKESHVRINIEVLLTVDIKEEEVIDDEEEETTESEKEKEMTCTITYFLDGAERTERHPIETWHAGRHILTLQYDVQGAEAMIHSFEVWMHCKGGDIFIEKQDFYEVIFGDGLAAQGGWDGTISAYDDFDHRLLLAPFVSLTDSAGIRNVPIERRGFGDRYTRFDLGEIFSAFSDNVGYIHFGVLFNTSMAGDMTMEGVAVSGGYFTGTGTLTTPTVNIQTIYDVLIDVLEGAVLMAFSFDGGATWLKYEYGSWVSAENGGMSYDKLGTIHESAWREKLTDQFTIRAKLTQAKVKEIFIYTEG